MKYIITNITHDAFHRWPKAPKEVAYLRKRHRHLFYLKLQKEVIHSDRAIEFITWKGQVQNYLHRYWGKEWGSASCEMVAEDLLKKFKCSKVQVMEDNESGAVVEDNSNITELAWLAGIMDGEGYLGISQSSRSIDKNKTQYLNVRISIANTNKKMIDKIEKIYSKLGILGSYTTYQQKKDWQKSVYYVNLSTRKDVKNLLNLVSPFLVNKKSQALLIKEYCDLKSKKRGVEYSKKSLEIYEKVRKLNQRGK